MSDNAGLAKLRDLMGDDDIVMLTTHNAEGELESRPMALKRFDQEGNLWFFTVSEAGKAEQLRADPRANVTLSGKNFVSISGHAEIVQDVPRQRELWDAGTKAWMQCEPDDPKVALVKVDASGGEYWESPGAAPTLIALAKGLVTGRPPTIGENEDVDL